MLAYKETDIEELDNIVYDTLVTDSELFAKYHISAPCNPNKGLTYILKTIKEANKTVEGGVNIIKLTESGYTIGFVVYFNDILYSFGINKHQRNKEVVDFFWETLDKIFEGNPFFCTLHNRNTRAIKFLQNADGSAFNIDENYTTICL